MSLYLWIREYVKKYSFIKDVKLKLGVVYFYYKKDGKLKNKHLPYRANRDNLIELIEKIKIDINYEEERQKLIAEGQFKNDSPAFLEVL